MGSLAGDESIDALFGSLRDLSTCSSGHHSDASTDCRPTWSKVHLRSNRSLEIFSKQVASNSHVNSEADLEKAAPRL